MPAVAGVGGPARAPAPGPAAKQSFWKKEISFGGKPKPDAETAPVAAPPPAAAAAPAKQSFWKKEISLGGKRKAEPAPQAVAAAPEERPSAGAPVLAPAAVPAGPATPPAPLAR